LEIPLIDTADANTEMRPIEAEDFDWIVRQYQKVTYSINNSRIKR